jgi:hypothetical protein
MQRVGEREQIARFILVVLDLGARKRARRRDHWQEAGQRRMLSPRFGKPGGDVVNVAADLVAAAISERAIDHDAIAEPFAQTGDRIVLGIEFGKGGAVLAAGHRRHRILQFLRRCRPHHNALEALENVERPIESF